MLHQHSLGEKELLPPIPQFSHDPNFIAFRSRTTTLSLDRILPEENPDKTCVLFLDEKTDAHEPERMVAGGVACLRNPTRCAHLNVTIICAQSGKKVFFVPKLPAERFLHLEFLQEGSYTLHYSPAFSEVNLRWDIQVYVPSVRNEPSRPVFAPA